MNINLEELPIEKIKGLIKFSTEMLKCKYNGKIYEGAWTPTVGYINLLSLDKINEFSKLYKNKYITPIKFEDIEQIIIEELFAKYNGNIFKVLYDTGTELYLDVDFETKKLLNEEELKKLEFNREFYFDPYLRIDSKMIDGYYVKKEKYLDHSEEIDQQSKIK